MSEKRLYIVTASIEFEFAVMAESRAEAERMTKFARDEWDARGIYPTECTLHARLAVIPTGNGPRYWAPEGWDDDSLVYGPKEDVTWAEAVERDKAAAPGVVVLEKG